MYKDTSIKNDDGANMVGALGRAIIELSKIVKDVKLMSSIDLFYSLKMCFKLKNKIINFSFFKIIIGVFFMFFFVSILYWFKCYGTNIGIFVHIPNKTY